MYLQDLDMSDVTSRNILIGCTGSVATIKIPNLASKLSSLGHNVVIVPTYNAFHFLKAEAVADLRDADPSYYEKNCSECCAYQQFQYKNNLVERYSSDSDYTESYKKSLKPCTECLTKALYPELIFATDKGEWQSWSKRGDPVKHIELREWADLLVLAPLDANTLAKIAQGLCDNLLTCIVRAWNMEKPVLFCPSMNTQMYIHPFTEQHINILKKLGFQEIEAISKKLVCGETGIGAMAEIETIVRKVEELLKEK